MNERIEGDPQSSGLSSWKHRVDVLWDEDYRRKRFGGKIRSLTLNVKFEVPKIIQMGKSNSHLHK